jgi:hypothetical protein
MADANRSDTTRGGELGERAIAATGSMFSRLAAWMGRFVRESVRAPLNWDFEQRVAAVGAVLLVVSTFGPFSFVEAAIVLVALAVLLLLKKRADGRRFHLPFGDGAVIMAAGVWSGLLIVIRLFDRPLGQNLLALVCCAILVLAGLRMRLKRPIDDLPQERAGGAEFVSSGGADAGDVEIDFADTAETAALAREERTEALPERNETAVRRQTPAARRERQDLDFDVPQPEAPPEAPEQPSPFRARPADE